MFAQQKWHFNPLALILLLVCTAGYAKGLRDAGDRFSMDIKISGTVVVNGSCTFTQNGPVAVDFGDVEYTMAGGNLLNGTYVKSLESGMDCSGDVEGQAQMKLDTTTGTDITYNSQKLLPVTYSDGSTSTSLGIRLLADGAVKNAGEWFDVDLTSPPRLEAELVQTGDGKEFISGREFYESATLVMTFN